ncbi:hypothetical protein GWK47_000596 [Chionoecetes opilio]|uniref:Uncharacterized protein n=1 Tax=Chionoecetes opilio TaxID=41210 RepID=A0A8J4YDS3_CHIOP|nr:hypothetical protein GWK47_000596 [Chionoecetes opilio]
MGSYAMLRVAFGAHLRGISPLNLWWVRTRYPGTQGYCDIQVPQLPSPGFPRYPFIYLEREEEQLVLAGRRLALAWIRTRARRFVARHASHYTTGDDRGVGALQLNRHFAETGTLPQHMTEVTAAHAAPSPSIKTPSGVTSLGTAAAPVTTSTVRTSRVMLSSAKKIVGRASRFASRNPRQSSLAGRSVRNSPVEPLPAPAPVPVPAPAPTTEGQESRENELSNKMPTMQGTFSLESLVEMLKVVQKFPAGSNLYTSVLQLVERLIHSMKNNLAHQCKTEVEEESEALGLPASPRVAASSPQVGSYILSKGQKFMSVPAPQVNQAASYPPTNVTIPMATPVSLFPLTVFSAMPSTVSGPKVARVAPVVTVAPTTVVSSPGLTRTVRVCVAEAPHLEEPPLKKHREEPGLLPDYTLARGGPFPSEPQMTATAASAISSASPAPSTFSVVNPMLSPKIALCTSQVMGEAAPAMDALPLQGQMRITNSQEVLSGPPALLAQQPPVPSPTQNVFRPLGQSLLQNINQNGRQQQQQQHEQQEQQKQQQGQTVRDSHLSAASLPHSVTHHHLTTLSEGPTVRQHGSQPVLGVQPDMRTPDSDPLLSQRPELCGVLPSSPAMAQTPSRQDSVTTCVASSARTHSDPLLSQSSPVAPLQMEAGPAMPATGSGSTGRAALMAPNSGSQVSMQSEVTSAINLSETELLNYFDPNCFDNGKSEIPLSGNYQFLKIYDVTDM